METISQRIAYKVATWKFQSEMIDVNKGQSDRTLDEVLEEYNKSTMRIIYAQIDSKNVADDAKCVS